MAWLLESFSPRAALWRKDWSLKPSGAAYMRTRAGFLTDLRGATDADGTYRARAFRGTVRISVTAGGRTTEVDAVIGPKPAEVVVTVP